MVAITAVNSGWSAVVFIHRIRRPGLQSEELCVIYSVALTPVDVCGTTWMNGWNAMLPPMVCNYLSTAPTDKVTTSLMHIHFALLWLNCPFNRLPVIQSQLNSSPVKEQRMGALLMWAWQLITYCLLLLLFTPLRLVRILINNLRDHHWRTRHKTRRGGAQRQRLWIIVVMDLTPCRVINLNGTEVE